MTFFKVQGKSSKNFLLDFYRMHVMVVNAMKTPNERTYTMVIYTTGKPYPSSEAIKAVSHVDAVSQGKKIAESIPDRVRFFIRWDKNMQYIYDTQHTK